jgi:glycosyltransferase involved in cell wall biosynthesis
VTRGAVERAIVGSVSAGERIRVLFVAPFPPRLAGTHGGAKVVGQLLAGTSDRHEVGLVYLRHAGEPDADDALRERLQFAEAVGRPASGRAIPDHWIRAARWRSGLLAARPRQVTELTVSEAFARLRRVVATWRPEVIRLEYPVVGVYLPALEGSGAPRVLADYDPLLETVRFPRSVAERLEHRLDVRAWRRFRRRLLERVDAVVVPTERDRGLLARLGATTEIVAVPFGADVETPAADPGGKDDTGLLFVGNLNHQPNRDSATFLAFEVLPRVRRRHPDAVLRLVGERTTEFADVEGVEAAGLVPDVTPFLDAAAVVLAPARLGAGMRVKVVEALVAGKAVVASPLAVEGLALEPGRHALVAESGAFADAVSSLLADRDRRVELARAAREWARENLRWERALDEYDALYRRLVSRGARARP